MWSLKILIESNAKVYCDYFHENKIKNENKKTHDILDNFLNVPYNSYFKSENLRNSRVCHEFFKNTIFCEIMFIA